MTSRHYHAEHFAAYAQIRRDGLDQWSDLHGPRVGYDAFQARNFLTRAITELPTAAGVLEYGCGTGAAACFLAQQGFRVDAVDLVPDAIELATAHAQRMGVRVDFRVADICDWSGRPGDYDAVVDLFCLQSIVLDADRDRLFTAVRDRLAPTGHYLIATAMFDPDRDYADDHYDSRTGIVWTAASDEDVDRGVETMIIDGRRCRPHRRHLRAEALREELGRHGFKVIEQGGLGGGEVIAQPA